MSTVLRVVTWIVPCADCKAVKSCLIFEKPFEAVCTDCLTVRHPDVKFTKAPPSGELPSSNRRH